MNTESNTFIVKREGSKVRLTAFVECPPKKPGAHFERETDTALPTDTIAFRLVLESAGEGLFRSVEHLEPDVSNEVTKVRITDETGREVVVPVSQGKARA